MKKEKKKWTYRDAICDSTKKIDGTGMIPISLAGFLTSMAFCLMMDGSERAKIDIPYTAKIGDVISGGDGKKEPTVEDVANILVGNDIIRRSGQYMQLNRFLEWLLDQDADSVETDEDEIIMWWQERKIVEMWNKFAIIMHEEDADGSDLMDLIYSTTAHMAYMHEE